LRWIQENTFSPNWLPDPLRRPLIGYLLAGLVEVAAAILMVLLTSVAPTFAFHGIFVLVGLVMIALGWGAGPGIFASLTGILLLWLVVLPPHLSLRLPSPANTFGLVLALVITVPISLLVGGSGRAARRAEEAAQILSRAEAQSRVDADRLRTILDVLPSAVMITSPQGHLLAMNQATRTLWGDDVPLGTDIRHNPQLKVWQAKSARPLTPEEWTLDRALSSGEAVLNDEFEIEVADGQRKAILSSVALLRDEAGAITAAVISAQDVTERHRLEREAAERAQELEAIFEAITDGIAFLDAKGRLIRTNQAFRVLHGVDQDSDYVVLPLDQRLTILALTDEQGQPLAVETLPITRLLRGETLTTGMDVSIKNLQGREVVLNVGGAPIRDQKGRFTGCVQVFRDVTARHHMEQRTRLTLGALVAMAQAMVQFRPTLPSGDEVGELAEPLLADTTMTLVARRLGELTQSVLGCRRVSIAAVDAPTGQLHPVTEVGLLPEQEQAWWASWSPIQNLEERYGAVIAAALSGGEPALLDTQHLPQHTSHILYGAQSGRIVPMRLGKELVGLLVVDYQAPDHDYAREDESLLTATLAQLGALVLERDQLMRGWAETRANELALTETKAQMDTFLGIASHELKTPLTSLKLSLQLSQRRMSRLMRDTTGSVTAGEDTGLRVAAEQLSRTAHQMERMESLVNDLVDVSRIQAGKLELRLEQTDLVALVRGVVEGQREAEPQRSIRFQRPHDRSVSAYADAGRIEQVVTNFLTNALKYSPADRPVEVGLEVVKGQQARVWVRDQGPGLLAAEQEQIWERFHRVKGVEVQSGTGVGLGLGLYISRMIVERHQGQIGVQSTPGQGATFWFTLPLFSPEAGDRAGHV
jgi:PAS domain S-box-containing protein